MNKKTHILLALSFIALFAVQSCKDPESPKAIVTVRNGFAQDLPVEGAIVTVHAQLENGIDGFVDPDAEKAKVTATTNGSGRCEFEFNVANILQVKAEYPVAGDTLYGIGVLVLEEDKTYEETVYLRQYKSEL